jgi:hypothetical protein
MIEIERARFGKFSLGEFSTELQDVENLRAAFLGRIQEDAPKLVRDLFQSVWPRHLEMVRQWRQSDPETHQGEWAGFVPLPAKALEGWAKKWHLTHSHKVATWVYYAVRDTFSSWEHFPNRRGEYLVSNSEFHQIPGIDSDLDLNGPLEVWASRWKYESPYAFAYNPRYQTRNKAEAKRDDLLRTLKDAITKHCDAVDAAYKKDGEYRRPRGMNSRYGESSMALKWTVQFQILEMSETSIAPKAQVTRQAVAEAVRKCLDSLGLDRRYVPRGGLRPRS